MDANRSSVNMELEAQVHDPCIDNRYSYVRRGELRYRPLETADTIRILILHPAPTVLAQIATDLVHEPCRYTTDGHQLPVFHDYTAVSYHWGPPKFDGEIRCGKSILAVTPNVEAMLRRLRKKHEPRRLWIDAICLNQRDADEKSVQIQRMGQIYREARKVIIWLGEPKPVRVNHDRNGVSDDRIPVIGAGLDAIIALKFVKITNKFANRRQKQALDEFLQVPWFKRRWVIQEATSHAHSIVHFGDQKIAWGELALSLHRFRPKRGQVPDATLDGLYHFRAMLKPPKDIFKLLIAFQAFECGDERDRISALRGLAVFHETDALRTWTVNYSRHWTEVYASFAKAAIFAGNGAAIYDHMEHFGSLNAVHESAPVWVPDWTLYKPLPVSFRITKNVIRFGHSFNFAPFVENSLRLRFLELYPKRVMDGSISQPLPPRDLEVLRHNEDRIVKVWRPNLATKQLDLSVETYIRQLLTEFPDDWTQPADSLSEFFFHVLPIQQLATKYLYRHIREEDAVDQFRQVLTVWFRAMASGPMTARSGLGDFLTGGYRDIIPSRTSRYEDVGSVADPTSSEALELSLLDCGIISDVLIIAVEEVLRNYTLFLTTSHIGIANEVWDDPLTTQCHILWVTHLCSEGKPPVMAKRVLVEKDSHVFWKKPEYLFKRHQVFMPSGVDGPVLSQARREAQYHT